MGAQQVQREVLKLQWLFRELFFSQKQICLDILDSATGQEQPVEVWPCDTVIYDKKYVFGLCLISGTELPKALEFPKQ